jgi:hypothetical protein
MFTKSLVSQALIDATKAIMEEDEKKRMLLEPELDETGFHKAAHAAKKAGQSHFEFQGKKYPATAKSYGEGKVSPGKISPERLQANISKKKDDVAASTGHSANIREVTGKPTHIVSNLRGKKNESVESIDELNKDTLYSYKKKAEKQQNKNFDDTVAGIKSNDPAKANKAHAKFQKRDAGIERAGARLSKGDVEELDEISTAQMSHQGKTTLKHIKNPGVQLRMAAHDIKPGIAGYRDRIALLRADKNKLQDEYHPDEKEDKALVRKMVKKTALKNEEGDCVTEPKARKIAKTEVGKHEKSMHHEEGVILKSFKEQLLEKSSSEKQARTMAAAAHNPKFAKKVGIPQDVAKDFNKADKGTTQLSRAMKKNEDIGGISTMSEKTGTGTGTEKDQDVRVEPTTDMDSKTVDTLMGRKKVPADYHNKSLSYKVTLNVEEKEKTSPMNIVKELARKSFRKITNEVMGKLGTSEEKKND